MSTRNDRGKNVASVKIIKKSKPARNVSVGQGEYKNTVLANTWGFNFEPVSVSHSSMVEEGLKAELAVPKLLNIVNYLYKKHAPNFGRVIDDLEVIWRVKKFDRIFYEEIHDYQKEIVDRLIEDRYLIRTYTADGRQVILPNRNFDFMNDIPFFTEYSSELMESFNAKTEQFDFSDFRDFSTFSWKNKSSFSKVGYSGFAFVNTGIPFIQVGQEEEIWGVFLNVDVENRVLFNKSYADGMGENEANNNVVNKIKAMTKTGSELLVPLEFSVKDYNFNWQEDSKEKWKYPDTIHGGVGTSDGNYWVTTSYHMIENFYKVYGRDISFRFDEKLVASHVHNGESFKRNTVGDLKSPVVVPLGVFSKNGRLVGIARVNVSGEVYVHDAAKNRIRNKVNISDGDKMNVIKDKVKILRKMENIMDSLV